MSCTLRLTSTCIRSFPSTLCGTRKQQNGSLDNVGLLLAACTLLGHQQGNASISDCCSPLFEGQHPSLSSALSTAQSIRRSGRHALPEICSRTTMSGSFACQRLLGCQRAL